MRKLISTILGTLMVFTCFPQKTSAADTSSWTVPAAIISAGAVIVTTIIVGYKILSSRGLNTSKGGFRDVLKDESYSKPVVFFDEGLVEIKCPADIVGRDRYRRPEKDAINRIDGLLENTGPRLLKGESISPRELYVLSELIKEGYDLFGLWCKYGQNAKTKALHDEMESRHETFMQAVNRAYHHGRKNFIPQPITIRYFVNYLQDMKKMLEEASKRIDEHFAELNRLGIKWGDE